VTDRDGLSLIDVTRARTNVLNGKCVTVRHSCRPAIFSSFGDVVAALQRELLPAPNGKPMLRLVGPAGDEQSDGTAAFKAEVERNGRRAQAAGNAARLTSPQDPCDRVRRVLI
jgi:hypothetical protein